jgi:hypothetical protein
VSAAPETSGGGAAREHTGGVLGVAVGLALLALLVLGLALARGGPIDGEALLAELFEASELPFGLEVDGAATLPLGDRAVLLRCASDWGLAEPAPVALSVVVYRDPSDVAQRFAAGETAEAGQPDRSREWQRDPSFAFQASVDRGELEWGAWRASFVRERAYEKGGGFADTVRVDLSQPGRPAVLFATWPAGVDGAPAALEALLARLRLRAVEGVPTEG